MKAVKFNKGGKVNVFRYNGELYISGTISGIHTNFCTFEHEYDVDYEKEGRIWTMICVPEKNIQLI